MRDFELCIELHEAGMHRGEPLDGIIQDLDQARSAETRQGKDHYAILGVGHDATVAEIKKAFKKMALQHHPDKQSDESEEMRSRAERVFKRVTHAYEVLSDPAKRREFDLSRPSSSSRRGGHDGHDRDGESAWAQQAFGRNGNSKHSFERRANRGGSANFESYFDTFYGY